MIVRIKHNCLNSCILYIGQIYSNKLCDSDDVEILLRGNAKIAGASPYTRTSQKTLEKERTLLIEGHCVQEACDLIIKESSGPCAQSSKSTESRNKHQLYSVNLKRRRESKQNDADDEVSSLLRDLKSINVAESIIGKKRQFFFYLHTEKQVEDVVKFCFRGRNTSVLGTDTTYNLCDIWVNDSYYRNKRLSGNDSVHHPVFLGPVLFHFTKVDLTLTQFALELQASNPQMRKLKKIDFDMEDAIFSGVQSLLQMCQNYIVFTT